MILTIGLAVLVQGSRTVLANRGDTGLANHPCAGDDDWIDRRTDWFYGRIDVLGSIMATETQTGRFVDSLPTLESSSRLNRQCLVISTTAVAVGLIAGVVMNLNQWGHVDWTDRGVLLSLLLLLWLVAATLMEFFYAPASHGRKAVYLTLASLGFLILAMVGVLTTPHGCEVEADSSAELTTGGEERQGRPLCSLGSTPPRERAAKLCWHTT